MAKKFAIFTEIAAVSRVAQVARGAIQALRPLARQARRINQAWRGAFRAGQAFGGTIRNIAGAAALATAGVFGFAKRSSQAASSVTDAADKLGVGVERFQELRFAADQAGVGANNLETGLQRLNRRIVDAAGGKNKELAALFQKLGIDVKDANGNLRTSADLLPELADAFKANENAAVRTKIAFALFDSEGVDLVRVLSGGSEALARMSEEARRAGQVVGEDLLRQAKAFDDQSASLIGTLRALAIELTGALAPALGEAVRGLQDFLSDPERRRELVGSIAEAVTSLGRGVAAVAGAIVQALPSITGFVEALGGWKTVGIAVAALFAGKLLVSFVGFAAAVVKALAVTKAAALAHPVIALIAAVVAGAALIIANWDGISAFFAGLWADIKAVFDAGFVEGVVKVLRDFNPVFLLAKAINDLVAWLTGIDLFAEGEKLIGRFWDGIKAAAAALNPIGLIRDQLGGLGQGVLDALGLGGGLASDLIGRARGAGAGQAAGPLAGAGGSLSGPGAQGQAKVVVEFQGAPPGTRVSREEARDVDLETDLGFALAGAGA